MNLPSEPTIVFAGTGKSDLALLRTEAVSAWMASFMAITQGKSLQDEAVAVRAAPEWRPRTYLDSGVFTFMRRAGVTIQSKGKRTPKPATWDEFKIFARKYIDYLAEYSELWDHAVELDVDEIFGIERADAFRRNLKQLIGDRLLPVWHAQRGAEGWSRMVREFQYVCLSPTKIFGRGKVFEPAVRSMLEEADRVGCKVHILGVENVRWFELGATTIDASSWKAPIKYRQFKLGGLGRGAQTYVSLPVKALSKGRVSPHSHIKQFEDLIAQWGLTVADLERDTSLSLGIRLLLLRQEEARAWKNAQGA